jgi:hypothetical protein
MQAKLKPRPRPQIEPPVDRSNNPTHEELLAKYGENFGLVAEPAMTEEQQRAKAERERRRHELFERICVAAGMPKTSLVSPMLAEKIQRWRNAQQRPNQENYDGEGS